MKACVRKTSMRLKDPYDRKSSSQVHATLPGSSFLPSRRQTFSFDSAITCLSRLNRYTRMHVVERTD